jgi:nitroreductase
MKTTELANLIKSRRSIRVWQDKPVPEEMLLQAVELATWAPNGANFQNWYFYIVLNKDIIKAIADAIQASTRNMASWPETVQAGGSALPSRTPQGASAPPTPQRSPLGTAPAMILVGSRRIENPRVKILEARSKVDERAAQMLQWDSILNARLQSVSASVAYLLLVLHQMGLGAVWMTGPLALAKGDIEKILKIPSDMDILAMIPVGYPAESPVRDRRPISEVSNVIK